MRVRLAVAAGAALAALAAGCGGGGDRSAAWTLEPEPGVRVAGAVSAEPLRYRGRILLYANTARGLELFSSRDGLDFEQVRRAVRLPLGAHAAVVRRPRGRGLRMYYFTPGNTPLYPAQLYSAYSADGAVWWLEGGRRLDDAGFGVEEVVPLAGGGYRIYYNDNRFRRRSRIVSATSRTGLRFTPDPGVRLPWPWADPAVVEVEPGRWLMLVASLVPGRDQRLHLAESEDGLHWRLRPQPLLAERGASVFDPELVRLGPRRFRVYYSRSEPPRHDTRLYELRSGILSSE